MLRHPGQDLAEHRAHLGLGQVRAEAVVRAEAEGDVVVRGPREVEALRIGEDGLVAVRRGVVDDDLVAGADGAAAEGDVTGRGAAELHDRRPVAEEFVDGGVEAGLGVATEVVELVRVLQESQESARDAVAEGFVPGDGKEEEHIFELVVGEAFGEEAGDDAGGSAAPAGLRRW